MTRTVKRIGGVLLLVLLTAAVWAPDQTYSVQVRKGQLRDRPSFLGKIVATVEYGDRLSQVEERSGWMKVRGGVEKVGWIHGSALSEKVIKLRSGEKDVATGASGDELALAGKGFNAEVEGEYRASHPEADFTWVDRMEGWSVTAEEARAFLEEGLVRPAAGGGR
jgi:uncharacterized protein YgiM (DUF1202 family)